jgi:hypothetical protein
MKYCKQQPDELGILQLEGLTIESFNFFAEDTFLLIWSNQPEESFFNLYKANFFERCI